MNYRGYLINTDPIAPTLYTVATEGRGGKIPRVLEGRFTTVQWVKGLIDNYLDTQETVRERKTNPKE